MADLARQWNARSTSREGELEVDGTGHLRVRTELDGPVLLPDLDYIEVNEIARRDRLRRVR